MNSKKKHFADKIKEGINKVSLKNKGLEISNSWLYKILVRSAYRLLRKPLIVFNVLKDAVLYLQKYESIREFTTDAQDKMSVIIRMVGSYAKGEYKEVSKVNVALSLAAILYFLSPFDLIPDFLLIGLADDVALLHWVYKNSQKEIDNFLLWEDSQKEYTIKVEPIEDDILG